MNKTKKIDGRIIKYMLDERMRLGREIITISELIDVMNISRRKLRKSLKRLERRKLVEMGEKWRELYLRQWRYNCRYQDICRLYNPTIKTCREDGGIGFGFKPYCGKYREYDKIFAKKSRKNLLNFKNLLLEINPEHDIF